MPSPARCGSGRPFRRGRRRGVRRGAGQLVDLGVRPRRPWPRHSRLRELVLQAVELGRDDGARHRVQGHLPEPDPLSSSTRGTRRAPPGAPRRRRGPVGVGQLPPVVEHPRRSSRSPAGTPGQSASVRPAPGGLGAVAPRPGDDAGWRRSELAFCQAAVAAGRRRSFGRGGPGAGGRADPAARGDRGRRRLRPVGGRVSPVSNSAVAGDARLERASWRWRISMEAQTAVPLRPDDTEPRALAEVLQLHGPMGTRV